jgi:hypothetical protein
MEGMLNQSREELFTVRSIYQPKAYIRLSRRCSLFFRRRISRKSSGIVVSGRATHFQCELPQPANVQSSGSSRGRGNRAAGWFADYLKERGDEGERMESFVLEGGIKGWASAGEDYVKLMDEYEAAIWER